MMLTSLMRNTLKSLHIEQKLRYCVLNIAFKVKYSTFTVKDFTEQGSDETGTLLTRFVKHLATENSKLDPLVPTTIRYADYFPLIDIMNFKQELMDTEINQIPRLIIFACTYKSNGDPYKFVKVLNEIDSYCVYNINHMSLDTKIQTLYAFMFLLPNKITKTLFYNRVLEHLIQNNTSCTKETFLKICFYLGLGKKNPASSSLLQKHLQSNLSVHLLQLTPMDISLIGNAAYKASVTIDDLGFLGRVKSLVLEQTSVQDDAFLVNLIKILRYHKIRSTSICEKLDALCTEENLKMFKVTGLAHLFAYLAECRWNNPSACYKFIERILQMITDAPEQVRFKDIGTYLWCCAQLQQSGVFETKDLEFLNEVLMQKLSENKFRHDYDQVVDCTLSLWMLGYHSRELLNQVVKDNPKIPNKDRVKLETRRTVLLSCAAIEKPEWIRSNTPMFVESNKAPNYLFVNRKDLVDVFNKLRAEDLKVKLVAPIKGINIAGILLELSPNDKQFVEILDDDYLLKFNEEPTAIMDLKIRLLRHLKYKVITINAGELANYESMRDALQLPKLQQRIEVAT